MSDPYIGEIRMFAGNFAPQGWRFCQGQLLPISEYDALFNLIGTTYGGDGQQTFALPNLQSRAPIHMGQGSGTSNYIIGQNGGVENVTLSVQQIPNHNHLVTVANVPANSGRAGGNLLAASSGPTAYINAAPAAAMNAKSLDLAGGTQPHTNLQPLLAINFIISLNGIYPTPN